MAQNTLPILRIRILPRIDARFYHRNQFHAWPSDRANNVNRSLGSGDAPKWTEVSSDVSHVGQNLRPDKVVRGRIFTAKLPVQFIYVACEPVNSRQRV